MSYAKPSFEHHEVNEAGRVLRSYFLKETDIDQARFAADVVDNWRASHSYPLNSFTMTLKNRSARLSVYSISALKRAYPNYFLDTADFLAELREIVGAPGA